MIFLNNVSKSYGPQVLFNDVSFNINRGERVGLVGRNGHGKTTLFRIITGDEQPDDGSISFPKNYRVGHLVQQIAYDCETVLDEAASGLTGINSGSIWKAEKYLSGLGLSRDQMGMNPRLLSGGYQMRLNLTKILLSEPDLLLLDEPNNYLDITSLRWLSGFLCEWKKELLIITHDRGFMDRIVTHTMGIHRKKLKKVQGGTSKLYDQLALEEEIHEKTRLNDEKKQKEVEIFINRFRAKARLAGLVQSRVKALEKKDKKTKLEKIKNLDFDFIHRDSHAKTVLQGENISFSFSTDKPLINNFNMTIRPGEKTCIIGRNGAGKTTLLKLFAGILEPDSGTIKFNKATESGYYEQTKAMELDGERTVLEEVSLSGREVAPQRARNICGTMMFEGDSANKKLKILSGGEKSRVLLGKLLVRPVNLLMLDEPTNHLDMESCDALLAALDSFDGAILMVTHSELLLDAIAEKLVVFQDGEISIFHGTYKEFLQKVGWKDEKESGAGGAEKSPGKSRKEARRLRSILVQEKSEKLLPLKRRTDSLEKQITTLEVMIDQLNQEIVEASGRGEAGVIAEKAKTISRERENLEKMYHELEKVLTEYEKQLDYFEKRFSELEGEGEEN